MPTLCAAQCDPVPRDLDASLQRLEPLLREARGSELCVLPELMNSAYVFADRADAWSRAEEVRDSVFLRRLAEINGPRGPALSVGFCERADGKLYNSSVLLDGTEVVSVYRKLHLFNDEWEWCTPGDRPPQTHELRGLKVGQLICFDWAFPEVWRLLALQGADVVAHPSNLMLPGRCQSAVPIHAMIQRFYVATANRSGEEEGHRFTGESVIAGPQGTVEARADRRGDALLRVEIDLKAVRDKAITPRNDALKDRRPAFYRGLMGE